ncbi:hypothetical protein LTR36_004282 [Oleoguttula mirabilis]|uniref:Uncharacterized protein n=1 Tax=Oleoguttula mirabilis TaxID=1507867 RepID=A0AAV9JGT1_9PEZI|nr:hypothetical protein LTR36_004282 [Oleoguttula mirabilis]
MAEPKSFNEELVSGIDALNKIEKTVTCVVERARREMDEARRALEDAQEHHSRLAEAAKQDEEEINMRRCELGKLFGKTREQAVAEGTDLEQLLAPVRMDTAAYLRTKLANELAEDEEVVDTIAVEPRTEDNQLIKAPTRKSTVLKPPHSIPARSSGPANRHSCTSLDNLKLFQYLEHASTIVYCEDGWVELRCAECGTNRGTAFPTLYKGGYAFQKHLSLTHKRRVVSIAETIKQCTFRTVPDEEVKGILVKGAAGMPYIPFTFPGPFAKKSKSTGEASVPGIEAPSGHRARDSDGDERGTPKRPRFSACSLVAYPDSDEAEGE